MTHQNTLHLSFKIKCCIDRLRPPPVSDRTEDITGGGGNDREYDQALNAEPNSAATLSPLSREFLDLGSGESPICRNGRLRQINARGRESRLKYAPAERPYPPERLVVRLTKGPSPSAGSFL